MFYKSIGIRFLIIVGVVVTFYSGLVMYCNWSHNHSLVLAVGMLFLLASIYYIFYYLVGRKLIGISKHFKNVKKNESCLAIKDIGCNGSDEIGQMVRSFNEMVEDLQISTISIERRNEEIAELKQAEEKLHESETRYRSLFNNMSNGVAIYEAIDDGKDFVFKNLNRAGEQINSVKEQDLIGKKVTDIFPGVKEFGLFDVFQRVWQTGQPENYPVTLYKDDRLSAWFENYVYKLPSGEIVAVHNNITERKQAEMALRASEKRFRTILEQVHAGVIIVDENNYEFFLRE